MTLREEIIRRLASEQRGIPRRDLVSIVQETADADAERDRLARIGGGDENV